MKLIREGRYDQTTFVDPDTKTIPIVSTIFYMDGDVQHAVNEHEGVILAEQNQDLVGKHMQKVELNVNSMDILLTQIQAIITLTIAAIAFFKTNDLFSLKESLYMTAGSDFDCIAFQKANRKVCALDIADDSQSLLKSFYQTVDGVIIFPTSNVSKY